MKINEIKELLEKYYSGKSSPEEELALINYFNGPEIHQELESYTEEFRFYAVAKKDGLDKHFEDDLVFKLVEEQAAEKGFRKALVWKIAAAILLLLVGYGGRGLFYSEARSQDSEIQALRTEMGEMRQMMVLNLLGQSSSHERMRGISMANHMEDLPTGVTQKLFEILNDDVNVNLKLALIEILVKQINEEFVVDGLIQALNDKQSTLVQLEIMQIMVLLSEKKAVPPLNKLLQDDSLDQNLEEDIKRSIELINKEI